MRIINSIQERQKLIQFESELFNLSNEFPNKIFSDRFYIFGYTTFEDIFYEIFFKTLKNITNDGNICIHFISPAFLEDDISHIEINPQIDNEDDYVDIYQYESKDKSIWPLDTMLLTILEKCIIYPKLNSVPWIAYCERKTDLTIFGFTNEKTKYIFKNTHDNVLSYNEILEVIGMNFPKGSKGIPNDFLYLFKKNYS